MRIMPISGNNIGFSRKGWSATGRTVQAQGVPSTDEAYCQALEGLVAVSSGTIQGTIQSDSQPRAEVVRSPSSPWGGREVPTGTDYSAEMDLDLEGNVPLITEADDETLKTQIAKDFMEWAYESNKAVEAATSKITSSVSYTHLTLPTKRIV